MQQQCPPAASSENVLNRIIRDIEAGVRTPESDYVNVGGEAVSLHTSPSHTPSPLHTPGGVPTATPSPVVRESGTHDTAPRSESSPSPPAAIPSPINGNVSSHTPPSVSVPSRTRVGGPSRNPRRRLSSGEKSTDRWGETETEWLCRFRNEVKELMGQETEAYGRARLKAGFWKIVEERMRAKGYTRDHEQCKNKFNQILDNYRRLRADEGWSGLPSYWDMNQTRRKKYNVDFVLRRSWYDIIHLVEKDKDSINLTNLMDSGANDERVENGEGVNDRDGAMEGGSEDNGSGYGGSPGGSQSTGFESTLGKRKRGAANARESSVQAVTVAMRAHTTALTRSDMECAKMHCQATRDIAKQQVDANRELLQQDIASRERIATIMGDKVESGYYVLADAIRSLHPPTHSPSTDPESGDDQWCSM
ncbi:hypothetical protein CBR_g20275 [Chara braunii]|uniref:Myb/SANT-like DNA-binding domain-containing protein n=1 Tax=Chara braunii TaxID=69332 RepID=A0A388L011_CHABU|nr:hypothetical protein CBR_g20275 [Chara braunii]|eukprot:GBG75647.1 hypothetical protein CBR_g20275 [Chara braunii]